MNKGVMFLAGLIVGCVLTGLIVRGVWEGDRKLLTNGNADLNDRYNALLYRNSALERRLAKITNNSYQRQEIIGCMFMSTVRYGAIDSHIDGQPMGRVREAALQPLWPVIQSTANQSAQSRRSALMDESLKLDHECLDRARISFPDVMAE
jgi:hypothetical protein